MRRPLICKIHRDLLLAPQNDPRSLRRMHDAWGSALRVLFRHYTPIFIGYGGNDDTLMDLLESLQPGDIKGQLIWCYYEASTPSERIVNVVADHRGVLVKVPDFDLLMVLLGARMEIGLLDQEITTRAEKRIEQYRDRIQRLDTVSYPSVTRALAATFDRSGGWWAWDRKAKLETDDTRREIVYRQALQHCPKSAEIRYNFALFVKSTNPEEAEKLHRAAIDLAPEEAFYVIGFGVFLWKTRNDLQEAEKTLRNAVEQDRKQSLRWLAAFVWEARKQPEEAEKLYNEALEVAHDDSRTLAECARFQWWAKHDFENAENLFKKAISIDHSDTNNMANLACLLLSRGRVEDAKAYVDRAKRVHGAQKDQVAAELDLYSAVIARVRHQNDLPSIERLKSLLLNGFERGGWDFKNLLDFVREVLSPADFALYSGLADWILDPGKKANVDSLLKQRGLGTATRHPKRRSAKKPVRKLRNRNHKGLPPRDDEHLPAHDGARR
jgi:protein O-mannosyl-transferase